MTADNQPSAGRNFEILSRHVSASSDPNRLALVIGNAAYPGEGRLNNPGNDARAMTETLRTLGFDVITVLDGTKRKLEDALSAFRRKLSRDTVGLVFYAGHGIQHHGKNYLIPIDATLNDEHDIELQTLGADTIISQMTVKETRMSILILDACRTSPYERGRSYQAGRGLAQMSAPAGVLVAYATDPGKVAYDGYAGENGPYTAALLKALPISGIILESMFKKARTEVLEVSKGYQKPWEVTSLTGDDFYFAGAPEIQPAPPPLILQGAGTQLPPVMQPDLLVWILDDAKPGEGAAVQRRRAGAAAGIAQDQAELGVNYRWGAEGVWRDQEKAVRLYKLSAGQGNALGLASLGDMYEYGRGGLKEDKAEAVRLYTLSAAQGNAFGQACLGVMYETGRGGLKEDKAEAVRLYRLAAAQGEQYAKDALKRLGVAEK